MDKIIAEAGQIAIDLLDPFAFCRVPFTFQFLDPIPQIILLFTCAHCPGQRRLGLFLLLQHGAFGLHHRIGILIGSGLLIEPLLQHLQMLHGLIFASCQQRSTDILHELPGPDRFLLCRKMFRLQILRGTERGSRSHHVVHGCIS